MIEIKLRILKLSIKKLLILDIFCIVQIKSDMMLKRAESQEKSMFKTCTKSLTRDLKYSISWRELRRSNLKEFEITSSRIKLLIMLM